MAFNLLPVLKQRYFDANGAPLAGGKLYSYLAGTSTPSGTFQDASGVTPNTNPIILDGNGEANVWISVGGGSYKFVLTDSTGVIQWTVDNVNIDSATTASGWANHAVLDGQVAADLVGETVDFALYSSAFYDYEILRGTTVLANGSIAIQNLNGTGRVLSGLEVSDIDHGVTFSVTQTLLVAQLQAALSAGPGNGTIKLSRRLVPA